MLHLTSLFLCRLKHIFDDRGLDVEHFWELGLQLRGVQLIVTPCCYNHLCLNTKITLVRDMLITEQKKLQGAATALPALQQ